MPPETPLRPGEVLAGKYRIDSVLGAGGMGVVVAATHLELDQRVAVKFLLATALNNAEAAARFVREARAAVKIKSEHVARVIDVSRLENGAPYIVMEYLDGQDLAAVLAAGRLSVEDAVDYIVQACDAMAEAHAAGIVHRDLKPSNLFLTRRSDGSGLVKVLDFGISKVAMPDTSEAHLTKTSTIIGSPFYMSPEQLKSARDVDHRTDVWSLGVILFELLAGRPPFYAETLPELVAAIMVTDTPSLRELRPDLTLELEAALMHCLQKNRDLRFRNVGELTAALVPFAPRRSRLIVERVLKISGTEALPASTRPLPVETEPKIGAVSASAATGAGWSETRPVELPKKKNLLPWVLGASALLAILAVGLVFLLRPAPPLPDATSAEPGKQEKTVEMPAVAPAASPPEPAVSPQAEPVLAVAQTSSAPAPVLPAARKTGAKPAPQKVKPAEPAVAAAVTAAAPPPAPLPSATARRRSLNIDLK